MSDKSDLESNLDLNFTFTYMSDGMTTMFGGSIPTFGGPVFDALMASFCSVKGGIQGAIACSCLNTTLATPICTDFSC